MIRAIGRAQDGYDTGNGADGHATPPGLDKAVSPGDFARDIIVGWLSDGSCAAP